MPLCILVAQPVRECIILDLTSAMLEQRINVGMLDCCTGPVILEQFSGMKTDRGIFERYPAGTSKVHRPGKIQELIFR